MKLIAHVAVVLFCVLFVAASPATRPAAATRPLAAATKPAATTLPVVLKLKLDAPADVQKLVDYARKNRQEKIKAKLAVLKKKQDDLALRQNGTVNPKVDTSGLRTTGGGSLFSVTPGTPLKKQYVYHDRADQKIFIDEGRQAVADAKNVVEETKTLPILIPDAEDDNQTVRDGWIGHVELFKIEQVIDGQTARLTIRNLNPLRYKSGKLEVYMTGIDTSRLIDDGYMDGPGLNIWVKGTQQYLTTDGGTRTVLKRNHFISKTG